MREVELIDKEGSKRKFEENHAENLLKKYRGKGPGQWDLPENSQYKFEDGKFYNRRGDSKNKKPKE